MNNFNIAKEFILNSIKPLSTGIITLKKNSYIHEQCSEVDKVYIITEGICETSILSEDGNELKCWLYKEGDIVGWRCLLNENKISEFGVKVISEELKAYSVSVKSIENTFRDDLEFYKNYMVLYGKYSKYILSREEDFIFYGKKGALYSILIRLSNSIGKKVEDGILIDFEITNEKLSLFTGISSKESICRMLKELKNKKIIKTYKGKIIIMNLDYLVSISFLDELDETNSLFLDE
ncbi:MAG: Crp/Fnr family transcriptional regulator [Clostridium sp.]|uniref:Crp/Fnr family transcriptional regulator n=1 Tax=Clostridium sp. TaxID=1506 RepID=UPI002FCA6F12